MNSLLAQLIVLLSSLFVSVGLVAPHQHVTRPLGGLSVTTATLSDIEAETVKDYDKVQSATVYDGKSDLKQYIKDTLLLGLKPHYYADITPPQVFEQAYVDAAKEVGVKEVFDVNLATEIRKKELENGLTVSSLLKI